MLETVLPMGEPPVPPSLYQRPDWVTTLGPYGRAAYEWRRRMALEDLELMDDPRTFFTMVDQEVTRQVEMTLADWENLEDGEEMQEMPAEFADEPQHHAARRAIEVRPCLDLVFKPVPADPTTPMLSDTTLTEHERALLTTSSWEERPSLTDLARAGEELAEALDQDIPLIEIGFTPTAYFPTELAVIAARNPNRDLYQLFN